MKHIAFILFGIIASLPCFSQEDSVKVFFVGNFPGEKFEVYWEGKLLLAFKGSRSYMFSFKVPKDDSWIKKGYTNKFLVYRKSPLGLAYKEIGTFNPNYEQKTYLIIWRNPKLKNRAAIETYWSDKEPLQIPDI